MSKQIETNKRSYSVLYKPRSDVFESLYLINLYSKHIKTWLSKKVKVKMFEIVKNNHFESVLL